MSEPSGEELRRLFASVRRERPSEALRERVLALGRAERERALASSGSERAPRGRISGRGRRWGAWLGCCAAACVVATWAWAWVRGELQSDVAISAEHLPPVASSAKRSSAPSEPLEQHDTVVGLPELVSPSPVTEPLERAAPKPQVAARGAEAAAPPERTEGAAAAPDRQAPGAAPSLAEQLGQLKRARAAVRTGEPLRALVLLDEYQAGVHGTELAAEASMLRIEALAAAGRHEEAAREARQFAADYPTSPLIDRARSFVGASNEGRKGAVAP